MTKIWSMDPLCKREGNKDMKKTLLGGSVTYGRFNQQILSIEHTHGLQMDVMLNFD